MSSAVFAVGLGGAGLTGCSKPGLTVFADEVAVYDDPRGGMAARLEGTLLADGGCLYVQTTEGQKILPICVRGRVGWDGTTLRTADSHLSAGEPIALGGGNSRVEDDWLQRADVHVPTGCSTSVQAFAVTPA